MATDSVKEVEELSYLADSGSVCGLWTRAAPWPSSRAPRRKNERLPPAPGLEPPTSPQTAPPLDVGALQEAPLLAAVLGCTEDRAASILARAGSLVRLARFSVDDIVELARVSRAEAERIAAACELGRRSLVFESRPTGPILGAAPLARWFRLHIGGMFVQEVWVAALHDDGALRSAWRVSRGDVHGGSLDAAAVVRAAARMHAKRMVLAHNHPSGNLVTTHDDLRFVLRVHRAALAAGIKLVDCLIVGPTAAYTSLAEQGVLPGSS